MTRDRAPAKPWYDLVTQALALRGMTKGELSDRSGVAKSTIDNWERNPRKPQAAKVNAVADVLGIDRERALRLAGVITNGEPAGWSPPTLLDERLGREDADIIRNLLRDMEPERADAILAGLEERLRRRAAGHG